MHRAFVPRHVTTAPPLPPKQPHHVGEALQVGEIALMRKPGSWSDFVVEIRGLDLDTRHPHDDERHSDVACVRFADHSEIVPLNWLRRATIMR